MAEVWRMLKEGDRVRVEHPFFGERWSEGERAVMRETRGTLLNRDLMLARSNSFTRKAGLASLPPGLVTLEATRVEERRQVRLDVTIGPRETPVATFEWWLSDETLVTGVLDTRDAVDAWIDACAIDVARSDLVRAYVALMDDGRPEPTPPAGSGQVSLK